MKSIIAITAIFILCSGCAHRATWLEPELPVAGQETGFMISKGVMDSSITAPDQHVRMMKDWRYADFFKTQTPDQQELIVGSTLHQWYMVRRFMHAEHAGTDNHFLRGRQMLAKMQSPTVATH
jgi:hypothetical protein